MPQKLFGILMLIVGVWSVVHVLRTRALLASSGRWKRVEGQVTESKAKRIGNKNRTYEARIRYGYAVDGRQFKGKGLHIGGDVRRTRTWAEQRCAEYPEGAPVQVFYDPRNPETSCIIREREGGAMGIAAAMVGLGLGTLLLSGALGG